jgi:hypothetical protein
MVRAGQLRWRTITLRFHRRLWLAAAAQLLPSSICCARRNAQGFNDSTWAMPVWGWANYLVLSGATDELGIYVQPAIDSIHYLGIGVACFAVLAAVIAAGAGLLLAGVTLLCPLLALARTGWFTRRCTCRPSWAFAFSVKFIVLPTAFSPLLAAYFVAHCQHGQGDPAEATAVCRDRAVHRVDCVRFIRGVPLSIPNISGDLAMQSAL